MPLWQRQPTESPTDFTAFVAYLRLKGRRSHRAVAAQTGRPLGAIRRLSSQFNWPGRVTAFETRLANATQDALEGVIQAAITTSKSDLEQFRIKEFLLAHQVIHESKRWLQLASDPRRQQVSLTKICRLLELAFKLKCLATGLPFGDQPRRRPRKEDAPGYWTAPSAEQALQKIYGSNSPASAPPPGSSPVSRQPVEAGDPVTPPTANAGLGPAPAQSEIGTGNGQPATATPPSGPGHARRDAWSSYARHLRRRTA